MKKRMVALISGLISMQASADVRIGNGGDSLAAQFVETADDLIQVVDTLVSNRNVEIPPGLDLDALRQRVGTAKVFSADKTYYGNYEVDALNYPSENKIVFSRTRFSRLVMNFKATRTLVVHEYMGLAGINDSSYQNSNFLIRKMMNGGDKGELWMLKDLALGGFQNPFRTPALEFSTNLFVGYTGTRQRVFQDGMVVAAPDVSRPFCSVATNGGQGNSDSVRYLRVGVSTALPSDSEGLGTEVLLGMQRPGVVPSVRCSSGSATRRVTLKDMLDVFGNQILFSHEGTAPLGNVICKAKE